MLRGSMASATHAVKDSIAASRDGRRRQGLEPPHGLGEGAGHQGIAAAEEALPGPVLRRGLRGAGMPRRSSRRQSTAASRRRRARSPASPGRRPRPGGRRRPPRRPAAPRSARGSPAEGRPAAKRRPTRSDAGQAPGDAGREQRVGEGEGAGQQQPALPGGARQAVLDPRHGAHREERLGGHELAADRRVALEEPRPQRGRVRGALGEQPPRLGPMAVEQEAGAHHAVVEVEDVHPAEVEQVVEGGLVVRVGAGR